MVGLGAKIHHRLEWRYLRREGEGNKDKGLFCRLSGEAKKAALLKRIPRLHLLVIGFYGLLAVLVLYGLLFRSGTHITGFDYFNYNWNFWWMRFALSNGLNIYENSYVMAPHVVNFGYHALSGVWFPVWAVFEPLVGTLHAMNIILFIGCFLNGYVLFVFLRREGVSPGLAVLGGAMLQISPVTRYFYYNNHINLMDWFWLPLHLLLWGQIVRTVGEGRLRAALVWAVGQGIAIWGLGHTDLQFPIFTAFVLVPYGLWTLINLTPRHPLQTWRGGATALPIHREGEQSSWWSRLGWIAVMGLVVVGIGGGLLWAAGPLPYMLRFDGELAPGTVEDRPGIPLRGYLAVDPVWWNWNTPTLGGNVLAAVLVALALGWIFRKRLQRDRWFWFAVMLPPLLLSMGPSLVLGETVIPMPFRLLHSLTDGMFRMPWRLAPIYVVAGAIFAAKTLTPILRGWSYRNGALAAAFLLIAADVRLYQTPPATDEFNPAQLTQIEPPLPSYDFYSQIGQERGPAYDNLVLLEVPTGAATGEVILGDPRATQLQFYGMQHQKRMLNGFISRAPIDFFWSMNTDDPLLSWLGQRRFIEENLVDPELIQLIQAWPLGYIVVHQDMIGRNTVTPQEIIGWLNSRFDAVCPVWIERDAVVYRTSAHPDGCPERTPLAIESDTYQIDLGAGGDERFIGWGWHWQEPVGSINWRWAGEYPEAKVYVDLPPGGYEISVAAQAFWEVRELTVLVNDVALGDPVQVQTDGLQSFRFELPPELVGDGQHLTVRLAYDGVIVPAEVGQSADPRKLSIAVDTITFRRVES